MDTFRKEHRQLTDEDRARILDCKIYASRMLEFFDLCVPQAERSARSHAMNIARTKLEETVMWAVKALTA